MGRLLGELSSRMQRKAQYGLEDPLKIAVHACHDTSLAGLCQTLDVFDGRLVQYSSSTTRAHFFVAHGIARWPEFTASVTLELFKEQKARPSTIAGFLGFSRPAHCA